MMKDLPEWEVLFLFAIVLLVQKPLLKGLLLGPPEKIKREQDENRNDDPMVDAQNLGNGNFAEVAPT